LASIRRMDSPPDPVPWKVVSPLSFSQKALLSIQRPQSGSVYRKVGEDFEIRPKANTNNPLHWFLNGRALNGEQAKRTLVGSGSYELLCLSASGEHALSRFRVY